MTAPLCAFWVSPLMLTIGLVAFQPQDDSVARATKAFEALEARLLKEPDVTGPLTPAREELALVIQKYPRAARSWQLNPSLALELKPDEVFQYVRWRANALLACGTAALSEQSLRTEPSAVAREQEAAPIAPRFAEGPLREGRMQLTPDCSKLVDESGQPVTLASRAEFEQCQRLLSRFNPKRAAILPRDERSAQQLRGNLEYLRAEYGTEPEREPRIEEILGAGSQVFSRRVVVFRAFIRITEKEEKLILLIPFSV